jgi:hypothetical protein
MTTRGTSLRRFLTYIRPYRSLVVLAAAFGVVRYLTLPKRRFEGSGW